MQFAFLSLFNACTFILRQRDEKIGKPRSFELSRGRLRICWEFYERFAGRIRYFATDSTG
jgi:hypothetical protein